MRSRRLLRGLGALLVLASILIGLPALLIAVGGNPLPESMPTLPGARDALFTPDDGTLALSAVMILGWLVWAALAASIVIELAWQLRGRRAPRLPGLALPQASMSTLVAAAVALFIAAPLGVFDAAPATAEPMGVVASQTSTAPATLATEQSVSSDLHQVAPAEDEDVSAPHDATAYQVQPGDTLWSIAAAHLGSGHDYHRIVDLNADQLREGADWVTPGMQLRLPAPKAAPVAVDQRVGQVVVETGDTLSDLAAEHLRDGTQWPQIFEASTDLTQPDGRRLEDPDLIYPGWHLNLPGAATLGRSPQNFPATKAGQVAADSAVALGSQADARDDVAAEAAATAAEQEAVEADGLARAAGADLGTAALIAESEEPAAVAQSRPETARDAQEDVYQESEQDSAPAWLLEGIVGSGALLGGALFLALNLRRRSRFRTRRPGRAVAAVDPLLAPVEKTVQTRGPAAALTLEHLDEALRRLGAQCAATGTLVPAVAAVNLADTGVMLHLLQPADMDGPWQDCGQGQHWFLPADVPLDQVGPLPQDSPAPFPLLVSIGAGDDGSAWLLNPEDLEVALTGAGEYVADLARYLAAEVAVNPWSAGVRLDCVGIAQEVAPMNPARVRVADPRAVEDLVAEVVGVIDRVGEGDVATSRVRGDGEDTWPARLILLNTDASTSPAADQLRELLAEHAGRTGASIVVRAGATSGTAMEIQATEEGRILIPAAGLDLVGVGLTIDEATGCAALLAQSEDEEADVPIPAAAPGEQESWRDWSDQGGAIRPEHTLPREQTHETSVTLLPEDDDDYVEAAATTAADLSQLSPRVQSAVAQQVLDADPTLDADLAAWWDPEAHVPKLTLLGPVKAKTWGKPLAVRKAYLTELLAYLALRPQGVPTAEIAETFEITETKTRDYIGRCREWLGQDAATGEPHLPYAEDAPATQVRGVNVYQVLGLLVDIDLFRRLRARAGACGGAEAIADLEQALRLVQGRPFDRLRPGGWGWLFDGDRLDHHMTCAVVDVAHIVATHHLHIGNLQDARAAAEIAFLAAPHEEIPTLDLAAVTARLGHTAEAVRLLQHDVCNRTDDPDLPPGDLPERTRQILDRHGWLEDRKEAV